MWLQMGEDEGAPLVYFHEVKHMWVGYADGRSGTAEGVARADERQAKAQVPTARKVERKQVVLLMQMQPDAQVAACVDGISRAVELWGPTRKILAMALYVWGNGAPTQMNGRGVGLGHRNALGREGYGHGVLRRGDGVDQGTHCTSVLPASVCHRSCGPGGHQPGTGWAHMVGRRTQAGQAHSDSVYYGPVEKSGTPTHAVGRRGGGGTG